MLRVATSRQWPSIASSSSYSVNWHSAIGPATPQSQGKILNSGLSRGYVANAHSRLGVLGVCANEDPRRHDMQPTRSYQHARPAPHLDLVHRASMPLTVTAKFTRISSEWPPRSSHSLGILAPSHALVFGGEVQPRQPVSSTALALPLVGSPKTHLELPPTGRVPVPRVGAVLVPDPSTEDSFWLWGGRGGKDMAPLEGEEAGPFFVRFADAQAQWETVSTSGDAPSGRSYHCGAVVENKLFIHAGCPISGRLGDLYALDLRTRTWARLADAPAPPRGGTVIVPAKVLIDGSEQEVLLRWGGFAGYELGEDNALDVYLPTSDSWLTLNPEALEGPPGARSVHGFAPLSISGDDENLVAVMWLGERDPSVLGHEGAGAYWNDIWGLFQSKESLAPSSRGFFWRKLSIEGSSSPEGRGWFAFVAVPTGSTERGSVGRVLMHGGLLANNSRSGEAWLLEVSKV